MPYPATYSRAKNFGDDQTNGLALNMTDLDTEYNRIASTYNALLLRHKALTNADGTLKNLSASQAQALAGTHQETAIAAQTVFDLTVPWVSTFSSDNVLVWVNGLLLPVAQVTPSNHSGNLRVTISARTAGDVVMIAAFDAGAGISADLISAATGKGASLIGIEDAGAYTAQVTVEAAIQELYAKVAAGAMATTLGLVATYLAKAGGTMTGDITFSSSKTVKGLRAAVANGEAVRYEELAAVITQLNGASAAFLQKSGGTMSGNINLNSAARVTNLINPATADTDAVSRAEVNSLITANNASPTGSILAFGANSPPSGWLLCDGSAVSRTTYAALFAVIGVVWGVGNGTTTFNLPDLRGRVVVGVGTGSGLTARSISQTGGEETHALSVAELAAHHHIMDYDHRLAGGGTAPRILDAVTPIATPDGTLLTEDTGAGTAHNTMPPFAVLPYIIKV